MEQTDPPMVGVLLRTLTTTSVFPVFLMMLIIGLLWLLCDQLALPLGVSPSLHPFHCCLGDLFPL